MIPNMIKQLARTAYQAVRHPGQTGLAVGRGTRSFTATAFTRFGRWMTNPDTQGNFNLPRELRRPFFGGTYLATLAVAAYYGFYWVHNITQTGNTPLTVIVEGVKIAPGFIAAILIAGLLLSPLAYFTSWGLGMLGVILKRWDESTRPENRKAVKEARELRERVTELEEGRVQDAQRLAHSDEALEVLRNQLRRSGQEPDA